MSSIDRSRSAPDERRRKLLVRATASAGGLALAGASVPFFASLAPSEREKAAGAPVEVDLGALKPGDLSAEYLIMKEVTCTAST